MPKRVDLFGSTYRNFNEEVLRAIRAETFGADFGQNSWTTADEYERIFTHLKLQPGQSVLEVACGSGGPAQYLAERTGCLVTGIDASEEAVAAAKQRAEGMPSLSFLKADADAALAFEDAGFDGLICIDSMNHFPHRLRVFQEWCRVLRPGARAVFTDPVVITGPVTNDELALRSSIGLFLFVPPKVNEDLIGQAGFRLVAVEDVTENAELVALRWHTSRERHQEALLTMEGEERFEGLQRFFMTVHELTRDRKLSRMLYVAER